jgi:hypothetical protein
MKRSISTESWAAFIGGYYVACSLFSVGVLLPQLVSPLPDGVLLEGEYLASAVIGPLLIIAGLYIGLRLFLHGRRYLGPALWYAAMYLLISIVSRGWQLLHLYSPSALAVSSAVLELLCQGGAFALLFYVRSRSSREA